LKLATEPQARHLRLRRAVAPGGPEAPNLGPSFQSRTGSGSRIFAGASGSASFWPLWGWIRVDRQKTTETVCRSQTGDHVIQLRALALSDRWDQGIDLTLRPLRTDEQPRKTKLPWDSISESTTALPLASISRSGVVQSTVMVSVSQSFVDKIVEATSKR
jgi:hypothetical protein